MHRENGWWWMNDEASVTSITILLLIMISKFRFLQLLIFILCMHLFSFSVYFYGDCDNIFWIQLCFMGQTCGCLGQDCRLSLRHCRRAYHRTSSSCHCVQLQLLLPPRDRPGRDAITELQPRHELPVPAWHPGRTVPQ